MDLNMNGKVLMAVAQLSQKLSVLAQHNQY